MPSTSPCLVPAIAFNCQGPLWLTWLNRIFQWQFVYVKETPDGEDYEADILADET